MRCRTMNVARARRLRDPSKPLSASWLTRNRVSNVQAIVPVAARVIERPVTRGPSYVEARPSAGARRRLVGGALAGRLAATRGYLVADSFLPTLANAAAVALSRPFGAPASTKRRISSTTSGW
jgi:hypothetical protein